MPRSYKLDLYIEGSIDMTSGLVHPEYLVTTAWLARHLDDPAVTELLSLTEPDFVDQRPPQ